MAPNHDNAVYNFATMDWAAYVAHRPAYTATMYETIFAHHKAHAGGFQSALDVGAGIGVVTEELLQRFGQVTLSDQSELYLKQAQAAFAAVPAERLSFLQRRVEDLAVTDLPRGGPVDLVTAAECLHWADVDAVGPRIAPLLRSGGTFAAWIYGVSPAYPVTHPEGRRALEAFLDRWYDLYEVQIAAQSASSPAAHMNARLDSLPLDPATWKDVRRIHTNEHEIMCSKKSPFAKSRVDEDKEKREVLDDALLSREVDYNWLEGYLVNLIPPLNVQQTCAEELRALKDAMGDKKIELRWPFGLILATKK